MQAIYHGTNSFAKENYRESLALLISSSRKAEKSAVGVCTAHRFADRANREERFRLVLVAVPRFRRARRPPSPWVAAKPGKNMARACLLKRAMSGLIVLCNARDGLV